MHISLLVLVLAGNVFPYTPEGANARENTGFHLPGEEVRYTTVSARIAGPLNSPEELRRSYGGDAARDSSRTDRSSRPRGRLYERLQAGAHGETLQKDVRNSESGYGAENHKFTSSRLGDASTRRTEVGINVFASSADDSGVKDGSMTDNPKLELMANNQSHSDNGSSDLNHAHTGSVAKYAKEVFANRNMQPVDDIIALGNTEPRETVTNELASSPNINRQHVIETGHQTFDRKHGSKIVSNKTSQETNDSSKNSPSSAEDIVKRWKELENTWKVKTDSILKKALPKIMEYKIQVNVSSQCKHAMMHLVAGLRRLKSWAVKMIDASGSLPSGSLEGTFTDLGDYDQCLDIVHRLNKGPIRILKGQYCTLELKPLLPALEGKANLHTKVLDFGNVSKDSVLSDLSHTSALFHIMVLRIGVCTPSVCSEEDIRALAKLGDATERIEQETTTAVRRLPVEVTARDCEVKTPSELNGNQVIVLCFIMIVILLMFSGTAVDFYLSRAVIKPMEVSRLLLSITSFSVTANVKQLVKKPKSGSSMMGSVNGIRCLSLVWIVLAHTYGFGHRQGLAHLSHARLYMDDVLFQIITNAWVSVDTFFMLGGLLVSASNLRHLEQNDGKLDIIHYVLHRLWRLTPPVAATVGVMFLLPLIGSGPLWADMVGQKVANCERGWWQAILPINTWLEFDSMCLLHTWYVAADIHFYCLAPLILIPLYKWPLVGFLVLIIMTTVTAIISGILTLLHNLPPTVIFFSPDVEMTKKTANLLYFRPYPHMGAYCVGLALGYFMWKHKKSSMNWAMQTTGWMLSSVSCLSVLFATYPWSKGHSANPASCVAYAMTHRTVWAAGVAWVIYACATGRAGVLNQFLSSQFFVPLSRLCYSVYLLHFPVLWVRVSWRRSLLNFHHYDIVTEFFGILIITLLLSIIFHIAFEAPFLKLEEVWFPRKKTSLLPRNKDDGKCNT